MASSRWPTNARLRLRIILRGAVRHVTSACCRSKSRYAAASRSPVAAKPIGRIKTNEHQETTTLRLCGGVCGHDGLPVAARRILGGRDFDQQGVAGAGLLVSVVLGLLAP